MNSTAIVTKQDQFITQLSSNVQYKTLNMFCNNYI